MASEAHDASPMRLSRFYDHLFVAVLVAYSITFIYWIISVPSLLPIDDGGGYFLHSLFVYDRLKHDPANFIDIFLHFIGNYKPPVLFFSTDLGFFLIGESFKTAFLVLLTYALIALYALYRLGTEVGGRYVGLAAVLFTLGFSIFHYTASAFVTELPLITFTLVCAYLTLRRDCLTDWRKTAILGLSVGAGLMTRESFVFFFFPFGVYLMSQSIKSGERRVYLNIAAAALIAALTALPWYIVNFNDGVLYGFHLAFDSKQPLSASVLTWYNTLFYPTAFYESSPPLFIISIASLVFAFRGSDSRLKVMAATVFFTFFVYLLVQAHMPRYLSPLLPLLGVLTGSMLARIGDNRLLLLALVVMAAMSAHSMLSYYFRLEGWGVKSKPLNAGEKSKEIVDIVSQHHAQDVRVLVTSNIFGSYNSQNVIALSHLQGINIIVTDWVGFVSGTHLPYNHSIIQPSLEISSTDFVIRNNITTCNWAFLSMEDCNAVIRNYWDEFERQKGNFTKVGSVFSVFNGEIEIYKRRVDNGSTG